MSIFEIIVIGIGLAMDCLAVSIASSIAYGKYDLYKIIRMALLFGLFQGLMPVLGWAAGINFAKFISRFDHWIALLVLGGLGVKMIYEGCGKRHEENKQRSPYSSIRILLLLAVATSIDAFATGLIFVPFQRLIISGAIIISIVSFVFTITGCVIGLVAGPKFKINVELIGGIVLIAIGMKIVVEHLWR